MTKTKVAPFYLGHGVDMVEIISPPDIPIILVFRQLITVTKFCRGHQQLTCLDLILSNHAVFDDLG